MTEALPAYAPEYLAGLSPAALIDLMIGDADRVPRNVIDECANRGGDMIAALEDLVTRPWTEEEAAGAWWLKLHAAMILGRMNSEAAGRVLIRLMRRMSEAEDFDLQDWLASEWPALFANKPDILLRPLRDLCSDRTLDWYMRATAVDPVVAAAQRNGGEALDDELAWVAEFAADEAEERDMRLSCGQVLLDFPRPRYRTLLERLAAEQDKPYAHFTAEEIERAYAAGIDSPAWKPHDDPWKFYEPQAIAERQQRWAREAAGELDELSEDDFIEGPRPYVRLDAKVGRNDPCPCGSGKKYKKCCLLNAG